MNAPHITHAALLTAFTLSIGCAYVEQKIEESGETEGDARPNQGPPEVVDPPEWKCRLRVADNTRVDSVDEGFAHQLEKCPFGSSTHPNDPWPGKPNWVGIPDVVDAWITEGFLLDDNGDLDADQLNLIDERLLHPMYVHEDPNSGWDFIVDDVEDYRSGMIFNFAIWLNGGVPDDGLRPPMVMGSLIDVLNEVPPVIGHPFYAGRYNAGGMPCSGEAGHVNRLGYRPPPVVLGGTVEAPECSAFVTYDGVSPAHRLYPHVHGDSEGRAYDETRCLDNGTFYKAEQAALFAGENNGLVWLNWDEFANIAEWVRKTFAGNPVFDNIFVFLDFLESLGWEWNYWPLDPPYPYARWSTTGVCGHPAALRTQFFGTSDLATLIACPSSMIPVYPDIVQLDEEDFMDSYHRIEGYCTFPYAFAPSPAAGLVGPLDEITTGKPGHGSTGFKFVEVYKFDLAKIEYWTAAVDLTPTDDGVLVAPMNSLGDQILDALDIPPMSMLLGVDDLTMKAMGPDEPAATLVEAALTIDDDVTNGKMISLILNAEDGTRLHRYIVPVYQPIEPVPEDSDFAAYLAERLATLTTTTTTTTDDDDRLNPGKRSTSGPVDRP